MPPELKRILPADAVAKLEAIHSDMGLNFVQKQQKIDEIMSSMPDEILDKIPPPPGFEKLPQEVRNSLKQINRSRDYTWEQKQEKLRELIQSLPSDQRSILAGPMGGR
ncbi:Protein Y75B7AR.1 [Aphelenchoides avenae]|nr:Protein Y75B7AR.1 [Aphelenchus avenae]